MTDAGDEDRLDRLIDALDHDDLLYERSLARVRQEIPSYRFVSTESLATSARRTVALTVQTLRRRSPPRADDIWWDEATTAERLGEGVSTEDMFVGFWVLISCLRERLVELAAEHHVPDADIVAVTALLGKLGDQFALSGRSIQERQKRALLEADRKRRDEWLAALLSGTLTVGEIRQGVTRYRLHPDTRYRAFCTGPVDGRSIARVERALTGQFPEEGQLILSVDDSRVMGLVEHAIAPVPNVLAAVGPAHPINQVSASYDVARSVLTAAARHAVDGVHTVESLGWRLAAPVDGPVHDLLRARYLDPLHGRGAFRQEVIAALRAYLVHGRSIPRAASALHLHVNTLRYRLARFEELTDCSLTETDTIVGLALALEAGTATTS